MDKKYNAESNSHQKAIDGSELEKSEEKFYNVPGSSRSMISGAIHMLVALLSSSCIWFFVIITSGWEGLSYFGSTSALLGLLGILGNGFSQSYIAKIKEAYILNPEVGKIKAASYSKLIFIIGLGTGLISLILFLITPENNIYMKVAAFACIFQSIFGYLQVIIINGLAIINRYDLISFSGVLWGPLLLVLGVFWMIFNLPPEGFVFYYILVSIIPFLILFYYFHRFCPYSFVDIIKGRFFSRNVINTVNLEIRDQFEPLFVKNYIKYSIFSTITNLEGIGVFANLLTFFASLYLFYFDPGSQEIGLRIITIISSYSSVKTVILYYSGPLNIEIAEAVSKENREMISEIFNNTTRISALIGIGFATGICAITGNLLTILHNETFIGASGFDQNLFLTAQLLMILAIIGQFGFAFSSLFGNALVGSGNAKYSGIGFTITTVIIIAIAPLFIFLTGFVGIGWVQVIAIVFLLPFMIWQIKKRLQIQIRFKLIRIIPCCIIMFLFMFFFPVSDTTTFILSIVLGGLIFLFLSPFFGVSIPEDVKMLEDLFGIVKLKFIGKIFGKVLLFLYNISPFNRKEREKVKI